MMMRLRVHDALVYLVLPSRASMVDRHEEQGKLGTRDSNSQEIRAARDSAIILVIVDSRSLCRREQF